MTATDRWRARAAVLAGLIFTMGVAPTGARADHPVPTPEGELPSTLESSALGDEHAAEHAASPAPQQRAAADPGPSLTPANLITGGAPDEVGRWVSGPEGVIDLPNYAIHAVMLPTGKVLFWGYPPTEEGSRRPNGGKAALWDPGKGTGPASVRSVDPPLLDPDGPGGPQGAVPAPLYCSGQTLLPNGDVLATGGNLVWPDQFDDDAFEDFSGLDTIYVFDPFAERWVAQQRMEGGRWYPSQVLLGDGRTPILGGYTEAESPSGTPATDSRLAEVFTPAEANGGLGSVATVGDSEDFRTALYPHLFTLPNDRVLLFGPAAGDSAVLSFEPGQPAGRLDLPAPPDGANRIGGNGILDPAGFRGSWSAIQIGGYDDKRPINPGADPAEHEYRPLRSTVRTDARSHLSTMNGPTELARSYANTVLLPDRSMVTVGGGAGRDPELGNYFTGDDVQLKRTEIFEPGARSWRLGPNQREYRAYHSVALLLPDGRVWSAGDDYHAVEPKQEGGGYKASTRDTAEIYAPPYLFRKGARPVIRRVPPVVGYRDKFGIRTRKGRGKTAVLIAPGATTHGADMHQRLVTLKKKRKVRRKGINVKTPKAAAVAPPGYYMLFVLNGRGKPSVAKWVRLAEDAPKTRTLKKKRHRRGGRRGKGKRRR